MADTRDASSLQTEIASALAHDSMLAGSAIKVNVDDKSVTLEGLVTREEEHLQAQRLAHSYAWNRKLVDHITVAPKVTAQK
jgi:osmotically-inducible protein OsmY